ncbi:MAG: ABC transporter substrate-binding protein [Myxococcota bacterium]
MMPKTFVVPVLMCAIAACGGDDKKERGELHLASIVPKTGTFATLYPLANSAVAFSAQTINEAGGVLGNDLVFDEYDEASGTNGVQPITDVANTLVDNGTQVWIGPWLSDTAIAAAPIAGANQRLMITPIAGAAALSSVNDDDFAFRGLESPYISAIGAAAAAYDAGARTAAALHLNFATGNEQSEIFLSTFAAKGGTMTVNHAYTFDSTNPGTFNAQAQLDAVFASDPDVIFLYAAAADAVALLTTWNKADWDGRLTVGVILGTPELAAAVGAAKMNGVYAYGAVPADPTQQAVVVDAFTAFSGTTVTGANVNLLNSIVNTVYMAALAIEKAGEYDGTKARDALRLIANGPGEQVTGAVEFARALEIVRDGGDLDFEGLTAEIEYDENGDFPSNLAERRFNASGQLDTLRVMESGVDF